MTKEKLSNIIAIIVVLAFLVFMWKLIDEVTEAPNGEVKNGTSEYIQLQCYEDYNLGLFVIAPASYGAVAVRMTLEEYNEFCGNGK